MGINCNKYLSNSDSAQEFALKLRGSFMNLFNIGVNSKCLHPFTCKKLYNSIVIPRGIGCEMLFALSSQDLLKLERVHRFCLKKIQGLNRLTRTDVVLSLLQMTDLVTIIDRCKLNLFGQLCRLKTDNIIKLVFLKRFCNFKMNTDTVQYGYFNDISNVLKKYDLNDYLDNFYNNSQFPLQSAWKKIFKNHTNAYYVNRWMNDTGADPDLYLFSKIHPAFCESIFWHISKCKYNVLPQCRNVISMISSFGHNLSLQNTLCERFGILYTNVVIHCLEHCSFTSGIRAQICNIIKSKFGDDVLHYYNSLSDEIRVCILLGAPVAEFLQILKVSHVEFLTSVLFCLDSIWRSYQDKL